MNELVEAHAPPLNLPEVLLVEDDTELRGEIADFLTDSGFVVRQAGNVAEARQSLQDRPIEVVVLDVGLPGESGLGLCRDLAQTAGPRILILSGAGSPVDRIIGLELGADDYVVKPVMPRELLARVRSLQRRRPTQELRFAQGPAYCFAGFRLDLTTGQLKAPTGELVWLTRAEHALLSGLLHYAPKTAMREDLVAGLQDLGLSVTSRSLDLLVSRLRARLDAFLSYSLIKTRRNIGYLINTSVEIDWADARG